MQEVNEVPGTALVTWMALSVAVSQVHSAVTMSSCAGRDGDSSESATDSLRKDRLARGALFNRRHEGVQVCDITASRRATGR